MCNVCITRVCVCACVCLCVHDNHVYQEDVMLGFIMFQSLFPPPQLSLWESYDHNTALAGGIRYQPQVIKPELVESFGKEFCRLLKIVSFDPSARLLELAREIRPPFLSSRSKTRGGRGLNRKF